MTAIDFVTEAGIPVLMPSGATMSVLTTGERDYLEERVDRYFADNQFVNISDLQDVDRMLVLELLCYRAGEFCLRGGRNWNGETVDADDLTKKLVSMNAELRQLKKLLGIDKKARDAARGEDSIPVFIAALLTHAKEFGIMREEQLDKALELTHQLIALITLHDNCDDIERRETHCTLDDVIEWIRTVYIPEFSAIDEYFRTHVQRYWIQSM